MDPFLVNLALAFVTGGATVALFTLAAERLGSRVGGLLLSFPVKVTIALVLVALSEGAALAAEAAAVAPGGLAAIVVGRGVAILLLRRARALAPALAGGLLAWGLSAFVVVRYVPQSFLWNALAFALVAGAVFLALSRDPAHRGDARQKPKPGALGILGRALFGGAVVASALLASRFLGAGVGGIMSVFPSGFLTSVVILSRAHGSAFTGQTARTMVAGLTAPALYLGVVAWAYPRWPLAGATLAAVAVAVATSAVVGWALHAADTPEPRKVLTASR